MLVLMIALNIWLFIRFRRWGKANVSQAGVLTVGLSIPAVLVCMLIGQAFRYRIDFYPAMDFCGFLGLYAFTFEHENLGGRLRSGVAKALEYSSLIQIVTSHFLLIAYKVSPFGNPERVIQPDGLLKLYLRVFTSWFKALGARAN